MAAPVLHTSRLTLRGHVLADIDQLCALFQTERARDMGGPLPFHEAWQLFTSDVAMWDLAGFGPWAIDTQDGTFVGQVGIGQPPQFPEREIGWVLLEKGEGKGYAAEATRAALDWAWAQGFDTLVSYITPSNHRSIALAEKLGAVRDPNAPLPEGETPADTVVYRHSPDTAGRVEAPA